MKPSLRVVVAEDEALIRLDLVEMLTEAGYEVVGQAGDGEAAIAITEKEKPDLVVMDVKMPKLDGISAAERIANQRIAPSATPAKTLKWRNSSRACGLDI